jgi:hypothetical protein
LWRVQWPAASRTGSGSRRSQASSWRERPAAGDVGREVLGCSISLGGADLGEVRAEKVALDLDPFDLDVLRSLARGAPTAEEPLSGTLRAALSEKEVLRLV